MDAVLLLARLILVTVFLVAAVAKLVDRDGTRRALRDFGFPDPLAAPLGALLPFAELCVAGALVFGATAWSGALGASVLLLIFVEGIAMSLVRGDRLRCQCFGGLHASPVGRGALLRTVALAALAVFVVVAGAEDVGPGPADLGPGGAVSMAAGLALAAQTWVLALVLRRNRLLEEHVLELEIALADPPAPDGPGLAVGSPAPDFALGGLHGERLTLGALRAAGRPVLLVFTHPGPGPCAALLPRVAGWQREYAGELTVALVSRGSADDNRARCVEHGVSCVLLQDDREVAQAFEAEATPAAVLVHPDGTVASRLAVGGDAIAELAEQVLVAPPASLVEVFPADGPAIGRPAPEIELEDLDGRPFSLLDLEGERVLALFWDPACPYCGRMLADLAAWAADPPSGAPHLVVVSRGSLEANRALDLAATVLVDPDGSTSLSFGATGTPMGVIVDEEGRIASPVAAGAPAIFELLSVETTP